MIYKLFLLCSVIISLNAHQTGLSYIELKELQSHKIEVVYKKPLSDKKGKDITIRYPLSCENIVEQDIKISNGFIINKYTLWCGKKGLIGERIWIDGLISKDRGVLIRYEKGETVINSLLRDRTPFIHISQKSSKFDFFIEYLELGFFHILSGYDHLLFVLSLLLLAKRMKQLLFAITAFTLSHSITLAFGMFGVISVGVAYIEAMIALSILFLARELLSKSDSFTKKHIGVVAFIFGLLHGFGFSSALKSIGLPQDEIPLSLFAFNVGIESGQLLFIALVGSVLLQLKKYVPILDIYFRKIAPYFIGMLSSYWLIDRVVSF
ncbi:HupE/UreJ family protein [Sulfurimonas sp. SAG-AH-194-L11]|nr:HupE/UreJ family protein [Sulfurimonas sp. SAG-AH-194-L11]MDF1877485.1 HupE/UreJ family protein [Sulfurimonas sp. SAG-AH-194-L11]